MISGAEKTIQQLWGLSAEMHGLAMGAALWGTVVGSLVGSLPADRFGRKRTLLVIGVLFLVGSVWSAFANEVYSFMVARFLGGIAIGVSTVAVLRQVHPGAGEAELNAMAEGLTMSTGERSVSSRGFWSREMRTPILIAFFCRGAHHGLSPGCYRLSSGRGVPLFLLHDDPPAGLGAADGA